MFVFRFVQSMEWPQNHPHAFTLGVRVCRGEGLGRRNPVADIPRPSRGRRILQETLLIYVSVTCDLWFFFFVSVWCAWHRVPRKAMCSLVVWLGPPCFADFLLFFVFSSSCRSSGSFDGLPVWLSFLSAIVPVWRLSAPIKYFEVTFNIEM